MVRFYERDEVDDALLKFAVIFSKSNGKRVFCNQRRIRYCLSNVYVLPFRHTNAC